MSPLDNEADAVLQGGPGRLGDIVIASADIQRRVAELGAQITEDYRDRPPLLVGVLKGAFILMADLARRIDLPIQFDFMAVSSYGAATQSSGVVRILKDLDIDLEGRHVLVVEDVVDSGLTLNYLLRNLGMRGAASIEVCAFLLKTQVQRVELPLRYVGFEIPPEFVVGYGLDLDGHYRHLPDIRLLEL